MSSWLGYRNIDDLLTFAVNTHSASTGAATDADAVPSYRVYEDETGTAILTGSMAKLDDTNTTGFYSEQLTLSAANGFEPAKCYSVYISAAVSSVTGTTERHFSIWPTAINSTIGADVVKISGDSVAADNLEAATDGTGYNVGGGLIVAASVTGAVGSVTGNVGGNVAGSVNSVTTGVSLAANSVNTTSIQNGAITAIKIADNAITNLKLASGAISSSTFATDAITSTVIATDAITSAELASSSINEIADAVWGSNISTNSGGTSWGGNTFGNRSLRTTSGAAYEVQVTNDNHISASVHDMQAGTITAASIAAGAIDANAIAANAIDASALAADAVSEIADGVWDEVLSGHLTAGTTGKALSDASTGGGGGGGSTTVRMGPFVIKAEGQGSDEPLDINKGATHAIECQLVDAEGTGVDITGATLTAKVYNSSGSLVETVSGTISYAALGLVRWTIGTTTTNTAGTYTVTITRTTGASDTQIFGPLRVYVRDI